MKQMRNPGLSAVVLTVLFAMAYVPQALSLSDETIKQRIEAQAADTPALRGTRVRVEVDDRLVVLWGVVRLYAQKMTYERIAWQTMGVAEVDNEIRVTPRVALADIAIERKIREIIKEHQRFHSAAAAVKVENGAVHIRATFAHPRDILFLKHRVAEIEGVIAIEIDPAFVASRHDRGNSRA